MSKREVDNILNEFVHGIEIEKGNLVLLLHERSKEQNLVA